MLEAIGAGSVQDLFADVPATSILASPAASTFTTTL